MSAAEFHTTRWTLVLAAGDGAERALNELCQQYRTPLLAHARRRGLASADAEDAVHGFFERLLRLESLAAVRQGKGRFRAFMLGAFNHYLSDLRDREAAAKRGASRRVDLDTAAWARAADAGPGPDAAFDREWALALLRKTMERLSEEQSVAGRKEWFEALAPALGGRGEGAPHAELAARLGVSEAAMRVALHRLRHRYRVILREEIRETVYGETDIDTELRHLLAALQPA